MTDIFPYICKHVIDCPDLNLDISKFVFQPNILQTSNASRIFINDYLLPLMHKVRNERLSIVETSPTAANPFCRPFFVLKFFVLCVAIQHPNIGDCSIRVSDGYSDIILHVFGKCQRVYYALTRFVRICRIRYAQIKNDQDLHLAHIKEGDPETYIMVHQCAKYVFRINELRDIIMSCITNTEEFFPMVLNVRNPYNNLPISICEMYNFYFFLKTRNYGIPTLLHGFFMSNFSVPKYIMDYEILIRDKAINDYVMQGTTKTLYPSVFRMLLRYNRCIRSIQIDKGFPMKNLVDIMRPYLLLYFYVLHYAQDFPKRFESEELLENRLSEFDYISPNFGKRTRSTSLLHITHLPPIMDEVAFRKMFEEFGQVETILMPPVEGDSWGSGYVMFANLDCADKAYDSLQQSFCYPGVEAKDVIKLEKLDKLPSGSLSMVPLHVRVCYNASHPIFHQLKKYNQCLSSPFIQSPPFKQFVPDIVTLTDDEDTLFTRIEKYGTVNAWDDSTSGCDIGDSIYVGQYYNMISEMNQNNPRTCGNRHRWSPSDETETSDSSSERDDCSDDDMSCSTSESDSTVENAVLLASMVAAQTEEEEDDEEICDNLSHEIAALSLSGLRTQQHLHIAETIYERLNNMNCDHDVAIRQIDEEFNMITNADESDADSDDEPNDES